MAFQPEGRNTAKLANFKKKITHPSYCCLILSLRKGAILIALLQVLFGLGGFIGILAHTGDRKVAINPEFYLMIAQIFSGGYGLFSVYKRKSKLVKIYYKVYGIGSFIYQLVNLVYIILFSIAFNPEICDQELQAKLQDASSSTSHKQAFDQYQACLRNTTPHNLGIMIIIALVIYLLSAFIQLHCWFTIRSYYRQLVDSEFGFDRSKFYRKTLPPPINSVQRPASSYARMS